MSKQIRGWICLAVVGGLLEVGIVYAVVSSPNQPAPSSLTEDERSDTRLARSARPAVAGSKAAAAPAAVTPQTPAPVQESGLIDSFTPALVQELKATETALGTPDYSSERVDPVAQALENARQIARETSEAQAAAAAGPSEASDPPELQANPEPGPEPEPLSQDPSEPGPEAPQLTDVISLDALPVPDLIREIFGPHGDKAVAVARCESEFRTHAKSGQFHGLFQMGSNERARYGHGPDALTQVLAAYALFLERGWQPWTCA